MLTLRQLQEEHQEWLRHNFPGQPRHEPLLGLMEEVGELAHAHLKQDQGIRGMTPAATASAKLDAVGDIMIFLASYCSANSLDLQHCLEVTWGKVKQRDWVADPEGVNAL